jgi:hypothetical protein
MLGIAISECTVSRILRGLPQPPMVPGPIWGSASNVHSLGRSRVSAGSSQSRGSAVFITVMNALQRNDMAADAVLGNDSLADGDAFRLAERFPEFVLAELAREQGIQIDDHRPGFFPLEYVKPSANPPVATITINHSIPDFK